MQNKKTKIFLFTLLFLTGGLFITGNQARAASVTVSTNDCGTCLDTGCCNGSYTVNLNKSTYTPGESMSFSGSGSCNGNISDHLYISGAIEPSFAGNTPITIIDGQATCRNGSGGPYSSGGVITAPLTPGSYQIHIKERQSCGGQTHDGYIPFTVAAPAPTCSIYWNPGSIAVGGTSTIFWNSANATSATYSCSGPIPGSGSVGTTGSSPFTFNTSGTETCTLNVSGTGGNSSCSASLNISTPSCDCSCAANTCTGQTCAGSCGTCNGIKNCSSGGYNCVLGQGCQAVTSGTGSYPDFASCVNSGCGGGGCQGLGSVGPITGSINGSNSATVAPGDTVTVTCGFSYALPPNDPYTLHPYSSSIPISNNTHEPAGCDPNYMSGCHVFQCTAQGGNSGKFSCAIPSSINSNLYGLHLPINCTIPSDNTDGFCASSAQVGTLTINKPAYSCSRCSTVYKYALESYQSSTSDCNNIINGTQNYTQNCSCTAGTNTTTYPSFVSGCIPVCTPKCDCAASTCNGSTCSDGCGGTCAGAKDCSWREVAP